MTRKTSPHHLVQILLILGLLLLLFTACSEKSLGAPPATPTPIPTPLIPAKPTYQVQVGDMTSELRFSGRIAPATKQDLAFSTSGRVSQVFVQSGDAVTAGQVLAELETGQSEFDLQRAQVNLKIAQLRLDLARIQTPQTSEIYTLTVAIQEQEVALAQIALDELNAAYNNVRLTAPISGTVLSLSIADGSMVEADKPVMVVATLDHLLVSASMTPSEMSLLTVGMQVAVDSVGLNIPGAQGAIQSLPYPYGSAAAEQTGSAVQIVLDQSPRALGYQVGDMVDLTIILEKKAAALWLPSQAVREFEGRYFVIVQDGDSQRRVDVEVGIIEPNRIEILDGLIEGQVVVAP